MAVGQNQWYHFGVGAPPILVYFSGWDWDAHWGYNLDLTHGQMAHSLSSTGLESLFRSWGHFSGTCKVPLLFLGSSLEMGRVETCSVVQSRPFDLLTFWLSLFGLFLVEVPKGQVSMGKASINPLPGDSGHVTFSPFVRPFSSPSTAGLDFRERGSSRG